MKAYEIRLVLDINMSEEEAENLDNAGLASKIISILKQPPVNWPENTEIEIISLIENLDDSSY